MELFLSKLVRRLALRFADDLDPVAGGSEIPWEQANAFGSTRDPYTNGQRVPGANNGWATPEKNGADSWDRHLL